MKIIEMKTQWTDQGAKALFDQLRDDIHAALTPPPGLIYSTPSQIETWQRHAMLRTEHMRKQAADLFARFTTVSAIVEGLPDKVQHK